MISLYIHIPFCIRKCDYCSFYSINSTDEIFEEYTNALINQINSFHEYKRVKTIYFGGGTPSLIGADRLNRILEAISYKFDISQCEEISVEVNPKTSNLKDFLSLNVVDGSIVKVGMVYNANFKNYSAYLIEIVAEGVETPEPEPTPEQPEVTEPAAVETTIAARAEARREG
jgi:organic radical activating enzyme